jgi:succinyl-CoA synthetase beta subunit
MGLWERVGADRKHLVALASITVNLYHAFTEADALLLEVNPLVITMQDTLSIVGLMMEIDASALYRHQEWSDPDGEAIGLGGRPVTARERLVLEANKALTGGAIRYTELDGDIALLVGGGGAGLHQHDLLTLEGAWPANHSDLSPSPTPDKPAVLFDAVLAHPNVRGMLLGVNLLQLAPCDLLVKAMLIALKRSDKDPKRFPIVIRLFGPREKEARELAASIPGVQYLPYGASLRDGVRAIVSAMSGVNNQ